MTFPFFGKKIKYIKSFFYNEHIYKIIVVIALTVILIGCLAIQKKKRKKPDV